MKTILLAACILLIVANIVRAADEKEESEPDFNSEMRDLARSCAKEVDIPEDEINGAESLADLDAEKLSCLFSCVLKKQGIVKDGNIQLDRVKESVDKVKSLMNDDKKAAKFEEMTNECVDKYKDVEDECEMAFQLMNCIYSSAQD